MEANPCTNPISSNRLCLDFVNLPFTSGDPQRHSASGWNLSTLAEKRIVSSARSEELRN
jgi:hypothetical protein